MQKWRGIVPHHFWSLPLVLETDRVLDPDGQSRKVFTAEISEFVRDDVHALAEGIHTPVVLVVAAHVVRENLAEMLSREVAVRVVRDEPIVLVVHVEQVVVLAIVDNVMLLDESRIDTAFPYLLEKRHVDGGQMEVGVNDARQMLTCAVILGSSLKGQNLASIDGFENCSQVIEDPEEFFELVRREPGKAHDVPLGNNHKVAREECARAGNNEKAVGLVHDVLGLFGLVSIDVAQQAVTGSLGNIIAGILRLVITDVNIKSVHDGREVLDEVIGAENGVVNIGLAFGYPNDDWLVLGQIQSVVLAEEQGILVAGVHGFQDFIGNRLYVSAGVKPGQDVAYFVDERRLA